MALDFSTRFGFGTGMQWKAGQDSPCRAIPACYTDEIERWTLLESGWANFAWDLSTEEEKAFAKGILPPGAFIPTYLVAPAPPKAQATAPDASHSTDNTFIHNTDAASRFMSSNELSFHDDLDQSEPLPDPLIYPEQYIEEFYTPRKRTSVPLPALPHTPTPKRAPTRSLMPIPMLSPSGSSSSSSSESESDWESEFSHTESGSSASSVELPLAKVCEIDADIFSQPFSTSRSTPSLLFPTIPRVPHTMLPSARPSVSPSFMSAWPAQFDVPVAQSRSASPQAGPSRTPASHTKRNSKPYTRKTPKRAIKIEESDEEEEENDLVCQVCGYTQIRGPGDQRSFKRHLETHTQYKKVEWRCRGVPQPDGSYYGGCLKLFARKDALQRHVKTSQATQCMSDFKPTEITYDDLPSNSLA